jgi:hypothetical protein
VLYLDTLADVTSSDIESYLSLHTVPPKTFLQVLVHLGASGMDRIRGIMSLRQNKLFKLLDARDA